MYSYIFDRKTHGYLLTTQTGKYVASEIRPVFAPELSLTGLGRYFEYNRHETRPLMWGMRNTYLIADVDEKGEPGGRKVAQLNNTQYGKPLNIQTFFDGKMKLEPVDVEAMVAANAPIMDIVVADAKRRTKELYDGSIKRCDTAYIAFSGGKDSVVLLDICHRVLPLSVPVVFSDTDMELPDTYKVVEEIKALYPEREFVTAKAETSALENWRIFAPPSRTIRWCCSVHKSTPALMFLKKKLRKSAIKVMAFVGVRGDESYNRSFYKDSSDGAKNASQLNRMPILDWGAHELWLYIFANDLIINCAYKKGLTRVGCLMCPESSVKHLWYVDKIYPQSVKPYSDIISSTSNKNFKNAAEKTDFVGSLGWQARRSGAVLKETLSLPREESNGLTTTFQSPHLQKELFYEWIKTIGTVVKERGGNGERLKLPKAIDEGIPFSYRAPYTGGGIATFNFRSVQEQADMLTFLRAFMRKVSGCIGCRTCEADCINGAISVRNGKLRIDNKKCNKCHKCYDVSVSNCWRYNSMRYEVNNNNSKIGFSTYFTFGLREGWISALVELGENFFPWHDTHPLGKKMIPSASAWFAQALLVEEKTHKLLSATKIFQKEGSLSNLGWELVWMALANNAKLVKWFVSEIDFDQPYTLDDIAERLLQSFPSLSKTSKEDGRDALRDMLSKSPLGGEGAVTLPVMKGRSVQSITRKAKDVHPLTILYGLYLIANLAKRESFTVRELLTADADSTFVSPLVAFGIAPDTFKKQCEGLRTRYPDYISTTFTHGNDGLEVYSQKHTLEDIINLALGE
ncbi:phosphoadenosine phosphosulfate reductase [Peptococcaceae bacterium CEB3]|nr:phosphoadenosine phosphosulfate reductase [Peptococcaceae bacterium CEB3]